MSVTLEITGVEETIELLEGMDIPGTLGAVVDALTGYSARMAASMTPVDTGAMQRAWRGVSQGMTGRVFTDPGATNPRSGAPVTSYAGIVDSRVGISEAVSALAERQAITLLEGVTWDIR